MRFAAIGLDHRHIYDLTEGLIAAGGVCVGHTAPTSDPRVLEGFRKRFPDVPAMGQEQLLDDPSIGFVVIAAVPRDRAALAIAAMRRGKDVMVDKPGLTTQAQLREVTQVAEETGRNWSVCWGQAVSRAGQAALELVRAGAIGRVVQTLSLAPHRLNRALRPDWFFAPDAYGGIVTDIGSHQIDQFLAFAQADDCRISATIGSFGTAPAGFQDFAEIVMETDATRGYARVDWFTPDGLADWGDGRLFITGTDGTIELRKNLDLLGRSGGDHLFLTDRTSTRHIACAGREVTYYRDFIDAVRERPDRRAVQMRAFAVTRLSLLAQTHAARFAARQ
jgi:predicted dehydrogenase